MITLSKKIREEKNKKLKDKGSRLRSVRDILLTKGRWEFDKDNLSVRIYLVANRHRVITMRKQCELFHYAVQCLFNSIFRIKFNFFVI